MPIYVTRCGPSAEAEVTGNGASSEASYTQKSKPNFSSSPCMKRSQFVITSFQVIGKLSFWYSSLRWIYWSWVYVAPFGYMGHFNLILSYACNFIHRVNLIDRTLCCLGFNFFYQTQFSKGGSHFIEPMGSNRGSNRGSSRKPSFWLQM